MRVIRWAFRKPLAAVAGAACAALLLAGCSSGATTTDAGTGFGGLSGIPNAGTAKQHPKPGSNVVLHHPGHVSHRHTPAHHPSGSHGATKGGTGAHTSTAHTGGHKGNRR